VLLMTEMFLLALAVVAWAPDTLLGKSLRAWLIEAPVRALSNLSPAKIIVGAVVFVWLIGMALSAPELVALIGFGDLSVYLDAVVIALLISAAARLKFVLGHTLRASQNIAARFIARTNGNSGRDRQPRRHRPKLPQSSDDVDPHGDWAFA
jgi:hypothetical protein